MSYNQNIFFSWSFKIRLSVIIQMIEYLTIFEPEKGWSHGLSHPIKAMVVKKLFRVTEVCSIDKTF